MELIKSTGTYAAFISGALSSDFVVIDIGCSGGIDPVWRRLGNKLAAVGFDPDVNEIERLRKAEPSQKVRYEAAFVGVPPEHPISQRRAGREPWGRNPWGRLAVCRTLEITAAKIDAATTEEKTASNQWHKTALAEASRIYLPDYLSSYDSIDFMKIDIDGDDFDVIQSMSDSFGDKRMLGVCAEVNFFGTDDPTQHTFHNVDRLMRRDGFELFGLTTRHYGGAFLPPKYALSGPGKSVSGRPLQGDAIYLRDICNPDWAALAETIGVDKLLKLSVLFSLFGCADNAAEIFVTFRSRFENIVDVDKALDMLAAEAQGNPPRPVSYKQYMTAFEANDASFYS
jgi:hypothetical protein